MAKAWREITEPAKEPSPKRSRGRLSGMRGVIVGAGLGVLAAKKAGPLVDSAKGAMLKYILASQAKEATNQVSQASQATNQGGMPSGDQAPAG